MSRSEAKDVLGDDWVQIHRRVVQQHANQYKRISWSKVCFLPLWFYTYDDENSFYWCFGRFSPEFLACGVAVLLLCKIVLSPVTVLVC